MTHHYSDMHSTRTVSSSKLDKVNYMELYNTITEKRNKFHKMVDITCNSLSFVWNKQMLGSVKRKRISLMAVVASTSSSADQLSTLPSTNNYVVNVVWSNARSQIHFPV